VLLAFHDDVLDRVTDGSGVVEELPWSVVQNAKVEGREPIPLFEDLLGAWPDVRVNIDPKHDRAVEPLASTVAKCSAVDRVCIGAFSDERLEHVRALLPGVCTSLGPVGTLQLGLAAQGEDVPELPSPCVQVPTHYLETEIVTPEFVEAAHRRQMQVHVWTIDDADEMTRLLDLGVDGIMTDRPKVLRDVLEQRGQWTS
jgi:glycerophosphoryl diester phosphodiesterase